MKVAFLGLGRMGAAMAAHVRDSDDYDLVVWNRTPKEFAGARVARSVPEAVDGAERIVTMLFGPQSVRGALEEIVPSAPRHALIIDATTVGPTASRSFARTADDAGLRFVDAPVTGSVEPATRGTLGVLAGGSHEDYADAEPLLRLWGDPREVRHVGPVGAGSALKLVVNQGTGVAAAALGEALALAAHLGVEPRAALDVLSIGAFGWTLRQKREALERSDFGDAHFTLELLAKDLGLVLTESGKDPGEGMVVTHAAYRLARSALEAGHGGEDYSALTRFVADIERT
jgi:3-hydroxyisobutyrate dehydrogenase-like beta-hydroxyacid dehydrogenase